MSAPYYPNGLLRTGYDGITNNAVLMVSDLPGDVYKRQVVSYVGYKTLEVPVNGKKTLNINLKEDTEMLDEVVVVGYGTQRCV